MTPRERAEAVLRSDGLGSLVRLRDAIAAAITEHAADLERGLADVERERDELRALARALVASLPQCDECGRPATHHRGSTAQRWCDEHVRGWTAYELGRAAPLRALLAALNRER